MCVCVICVNQSFNIKKSSTALSCQLSPGIYTCLQACKTEINTLDVTDAYNCNKHLRPPNIRALESLPKHQTPVLCLLFRSIREYKV